MDIIKFIIIATIVTIILGCWFMANSGEINNYLSETKLSAHDRYNIRTIDNTDINNTNWFLPNAIKSWFNSMWSSFGSDNTQSQTQPQGPKRLGDPLGTTNINPNEFT